MGSGASNPSDNDFSLTEKQEIKKLLESKYSESITKSATEVELFNNISSSYTNQVNVVLQKRKEAVGPVIKSPVIEIVEKTNDISSTDKLDNFIESINQSNSSSPSPLAINENGSNLIGDDNKLPVRRERSRSGIPQGLGTMTDSILEFETENSLLSVPSSVELLNNVTDDMNTEVTDKINKFILQMKEGDLVAKPASEFRKKRLTFASDISNIEKSDEKYVQEVVPTYEVTDKLPDIRDISSDTFKSDIIPALSQKKTLKRSYSYRSTRRTTIYASTEIGVTQEKTSPFTNDFMGTYSCHGVEPDPNSDGALDKINQDRGCVVYPFHSSKEEALFVVLDGHGEQGDRVSEFVMRQLVMTLEKNEKLATDVAEAMKETFIKTNSALVTTPIQYMTSGCTCVSAYMIGTTLHIANCGDSRCVMAIKTDEVDENDNAVVVSHDLSVDHKPDDPAEKERIEAWGGYVCPPYEEGLSARVYLDPEFTMIGLAMARSIGDFAVKSVGVIPEPDVVKYEVTEKDKFMILASDGVWEFITSQEAIDIVNSCIDQGCYEACEELIQVAALRWSEEEGDYRDDITAIVVKFPLPHQNFEKNP
jgi:serine/threonine protein phosphatase PrpC